MKHTKREIFVPFLCENPQAEQIHGQSEPYEGNFPESLSTLCGTNALKTLRVPLGGTWKIHSALGRPVYAKEQCHFSLGKMHFI